MAAIKKEDNIMSENVVVQIPPLDPNDETIEAMTESRSGNLKSFDSITALMEDLNAKD